MVARAGAAFVAVAPRVTGFVLARFFCIDLILLRGVQGEEEAASELRGGPRRGVYHASRPAPMRHVRVRGDGSGEG